MKAVLVIVRFVANRTPPSTHAYIPPRRRCRALNDQVAPRILRGAIELIQKELEVVGEEEDTAEAEEEDDGAPDDTENEPKSARSIVLHRIKSWAAHLQPVASDAEPGKHKGQGNSDDRSWAARYAESCVHKVPDVQLPTPPHV